MRKQKTIRCVRPGFQDELNAVISALSTTYRRTNYVRQRDFRKIQGFVTDTCRGRAHYDGRFTVPLWTLKRGKDYFTWYVAHELSHQFTFLKYGRHVRSHGAEFYAVFKQVCPLEYQHYELNYKPTAKAYGISKKYFELVSEPAEIFFLSDHIK